MANLLVFPNDPNNGAWSAGSGTGNVALNFALAPDGTNNAFQLDDVDATAVFSRAQPVTIPADTASYVVDVWVQKTVGALNFPALDFRFGANNILAALVINTDAGTITPRTGWNPDASGIASWDANYWHVYLVKANGGFTSCQVYLEPAFNLDASGTPNVGATGPAVFWLPRLNLGTTPPALTSPATFFSLM